LGAFLLLNYTCPQQTLDQFPESLTVVELSDRGSTDQRTFKNTGAKKRLGPINEKKSRAISSEQIVNPLTALMVLSES
jgi:hypothetical protein